jgi:hypothetical protein
VCPECGTSLDADGYCQDAGCPRCGKTVPADERSTRPDLGCPRCGGHGEVDASTASGAPDEWPLDWYPCPACRGSGDRPTNADRAAWVIAALERFGALTGQRGYFTEPVDREAACEIVADFLGDLLHLCDRLGLDFDPLLDRGRGDFEAEVECPTCLGTPHPLEGTCVNEECPDVGRSTWALRSEQRATAEGLAQVANLPGEIHPLDPFGIEG